jgi:2-polyprenyl-3-methyl-5-hydroxy-6-metoxy-1,4-benzoquinol methylase
MQGENEPVLKYDYPFDPDEPNNTAASVYALARAGGGRVLDIGSGPATVSQVLATADGREVTCLDRDEIALTEAASRGVQRTFVSDLDSPDWLAPIRDETFDTVILADVLEHLRDPGSLLRDLRDRSLLADDGRVVVSIPNANHQAVLAELLSGDFRYTTTGLLDATHIRWFTLDSLQRLLEEAGFVVAEVRRTLRDLDQTVHAHRLAGLGESARAAISELGLEGRTYQYVILARPAAEPARLVELSEALHAERLKVKDEAAKVHQEKAKAREQAEETARVRRRLEDVQTLLAEERGRVIAELEAGAAEFEALVEERDRLRSELRVAKERGDKLQVRISRLTSGRAYRVYRAVRQIPQHAPGELVRRAGRGAGKGRKA